MDAYRLALEQGEKELAEAQNQHRRIALRVSQLEALVTQLRAFVVKGGSVDTPLFDSSTPTVTAVVPGATVNTADNRAPLWKAIITALNGQKGDFTVPNALMALERTGRIIESKNRLNIIRNTLIQRNDLFGKLGTGHYFVHGFEKKNSEENEKEATEVTSF